MPGSFVVNLGDMVPRLSNGHYRSTPHRVLNNRSGRDRHSIATFFNPHYHYRFSCVPTCLRDDETPPPVSYGEHLSHMFELTYGQPAVS